VVFAIRHAIGNAIGNAIRDDDGHLGAIAQGMPIWDDGHLGAIAQGMWRRRSALRRPLPRRPRHVRPSPSGVADGHGRDERTARTAGGATIFARGAGCWRFRLRHTRRTRPRHTHWRLTRRGVRLRLGVVATDAAARPALEGPCIACSR
jgi:hypothetical protein